MKRKIFSILFALVLMLSLMLMPAAVSANPGIGLNAVGSGTAEISTATAKSPTHSVKLVVPDGTADMAAVVFDVDIALEDITTLSFWKMVTAYDTTGWNPTVILLIDADGDGLEFGISEAMEWHFTHSAALLFDDAFVELESPTGLTAPETTWTQLDALAMSAWGADASGYLYGTGGYSAGLTGFQSGGPYGVIDPSDKVLMVAIVIGGAGSFMAETAYVDDVTINGDFYDFEPTSSVGLTVAVPDIVAISANPTSIDFGTLVPGQTSSVFDITVENIGTHEVDVDADVSGAALFTNNLELRNPPAAFSSTNPWNIIINDLAMGASEGLKTQLPVPGAYTPTGTETATLVFTATGT